MKRYTVTLEQSEREALEGITRKGAHRPQKVINALVLLNCDEGAFVVRHILSLNHRAFWSVYLPGETSDVVD